MEPTAVKKKKDADISQGIQQATKLLNVSGATRFQWSTSTSA